MSQLGRQDCPAIPCSHMASLGRWSCYCGQLPLRRSHLDFYRNRHPMSHHSVSAKVDVDGCAFKLCCVTSAIGEQWSIASRRRVSCPHISCLQRQDMPAFQHVLICCDRDTRLSSSLDFLLFPGLMKLRGLIYGTTAVPGKRVLGADCVSRSGCVARQRQAAAGTGSWRREHEEERDRSRSYS